MEQENKKQGIDPMEQPLWEKHDFIDNPFKDVEGVVEFPIKVEKVKEGCQADFELLEKNWMDEWEIEDDGTIVSKISPHYYIDADRLTESDWIAHMSGKAWCDLNTFIPAYFEAMMRAGVKQLTIDIY